MPDKNSRPATAPGHTSKSGLCGNPKVAELLGDRTTGQPDWVRCPVRGPEPHCGFTRPYLYQLAGAGLIRSVSIRQPGAVRGVRLFNLPSVYAYIERCEREQGGRP